MFSPEKVNTCGHPHYTITNGVCSMCEHGWDSHRHYWITQYDGDIATSYKCTVCGARHEIL